MRECPKCTAPIANDAIVCNTCGWTPDRTLGKPNLYGRRHPNGDRLCEWTDRATNEYGCAELGSLSENLREGGPWFCHRHFPPFRARSTNRSLPPGGFGSMRQIVTPKQLDFEAVAERLAIQNERAA